MQRATALARLTINCQPSVDPQLTDTELGVILDMYALADASGLAPTEQGWQGVWDIQGASRKAWEVKASKAALDVDTDVDGAKYSQSQVYAHCLAMAERYGTQGAASVGAF